MLLRLTAHTRVCPGRYFAEAAIFINVAAALHVFDISPPLDEQGSPITIVPRMTDGAIRYAVRRCGLITRVLIEARKFIVTRKIVVALSNHALPERRY